MGKGKRLMLRISFLFIEEVKEGMNVRFIDY